MPSSSWKEKGEKKNPFKAKCSQCMISHANIDSESQSRGVKYFNKCHIHTLLKEELCPSIFAPKD